jgi:hypothetical protein
VFGVGGYLQAQPEISGNPLKAVGEQLVVYRSHIRRTHAEYYYSTSHDEKVTLERNRIRTRGSCAVKYRVQALPKAAWHTCALNIAVTPPLFRVWLPVHLAWPIERLQDRIVLLHSGKDIGPKEQHRCKKVNCMLATRRHRKQLNERRGAQSIHSNRGDLTQAFVGNL